jgi:hypothetical protein
MSRELVSYLPGMRWLRVGRVRSKPVLEFVDRSVETRSVDGVSGAASALTERLAVETQGAFDPDARCGVTIPTEQELDAPGFRTAGRGMRGFRIVMHRLCLGSPQEVKE